MIGNDFIGVNRGNVLIHREGNIGGSRSVFVGLKGIKNELVFFPFGGAIKNPFKGTAKLYAGDLVEYRTNENGVKPEIYILKTYLVEKISETTLTLVKDGYKHIPFVGDKIGVAPSKIGEAVTQYGTITGVKVVKVSGVEYFECTLDKTFTTTKGDVLVEVGTDNKMMVKNINGVCDCDLDMLYAPSTGDSDFDNARYHYVPAMNGTMYINRMSPLPKCVLDLNKSNVNGWFKVEF